MPSETGGSGGVSSHWAVVGEKLRQEKGGVEGFDGDNTRELECPTFGWVGALFQHSDVGITVKPWQVLQ